MALLERKKKTIVFDLDGTISDFENIDHEIVNEIFPNSKIVKLIDRIAWCINRKDIIKNTMLILMIRLALYSFISCKSLKKVFNKYRQEYFFKTYKDLRKIYPRLEELSKKYRIRIISNNKYSSGIKYKKIKVRYMSSKLNFIRCLKKNRHNILYIIGNNLCDDILVAKSLNDKSIYVGKNSFVRFIADESFDNISRVIDYLDNL